MVTPAAPRSRITAAALTSIFVRLETRFVGLVAVADRAKPPAVWCGESGCARVGCRRRTPSDAALAEPQKRRTPGHFVGEPTADEVDLNDPHRAPPSL